MKSGDPGSTFVMRPTSPQYPGTVHRTRSPTFIYNLHRIAADDLAVASSSTWGERKPPNMYVNPLAPFNIARTPIGVEWSGHNVSGLWCFSSHAGSLFCDFQGSRQVLGDNSGAEDGPCPHLVYIIADRGHFVKALSESVQSRRRLHK